MSLFDSQLAWLANRGTEASIAGWEPERFGNAHPSIVPYETFPTSSAHVVVAVGTDAQFRQLCEAIGLPDAPDDPRFATNPQRVADKEALIAELEPLFAARGRDELVETLRAAGVPAAPVQDAGEVWSHPDR